MKYGELNLGQIEALVNILGGMDAVKVLLADRAKAIEVVSTSMGLGAIFSNFLDCPGQIQKRYPELVQLRDDVLHLSIFLLHYHAVVSDIADSPESLSRLARHLLGAFGGKKIIVHHERRKNIIPTDPLIMADSVSAEFYYNSSDKGGILPEIPGLMEWEYDPAVIEHTKYHGYNALWRQISPATIPGTNA